MFISSPVRSARIAAVEFAAPAVASSATPTPTLETDTSCSGSYFDGTQATMLLAAANARDVATAPCIGDEHAKTPTLQPAAATGLVVRIDLGMGQQRCGDSRHVGAARTTTPPPARLRDKRADTGWNIP
jgi:hypothetical protein